MPLLLPAGMWRSLIILFVATVGVSRDIGLSVGGVTLNYDTNDQENMLAIYNFCQDLSSSCDIPPCPSLSECMSTLDPMMSRLDSLLGSDQGGDNGESRTHEPHHSSSSNSSSSGGKLTSEPITEDLTFEVIVDSSGRRANFIYRADGDDINTQVTSFCSNELENETEIETCRKSMLDAVVRSLTNNNDQSPKTPSRSLSWIEKDYSYFDREVKELVELEVQVDTDGHTTTFTHIPQQNPYLEAHQFCIKNFPSLDSEQCVEQLVSVLENHVRALVEDEKKKKVTSSMVDLLGDRLVSGGLSEGSEEGLSTARALRGIKVIGLYFAADWCAPCRQFTPILIKYYHMVRDFKRKGFEVIWVSASRDPQGFDTYLRGMPWTALPFEDRNRYNSLRARYSISSFPSLVFIDANSGELITKDARNMVANDPNAHGYPYASPIKAVGRFLKKVLNSFLPEKIKNAIFV